MAYDPYVPVEKNIDDMQKILEDKLGIGISFDVGQRELIVMERRIQFCAQCDIRQRLLRYLLSRRRRYMS